MQCVEKSEFAKLDFSGFRCVEDQGDFVTMNLVDTSIEQEILEQEIEVLTPSIPENCLHLHYLMATPFRHLPAKWGSRFGTKSQPGMLYGSLEEETALAETAYYQLRFFQASKGTFHPVTKGF